MDQESKKLLEETYELERENNKMLHKLRRAQKNAVLMSVAYWFIVIGISVGAFYFVQPYVDSAIKLYKDANQSINQIKGFLPK